MDIWELFCRLLTYEDISSLSLTSKQILKVTRRGALYEYLLKRDFNLNLSFILQRVKKYNSFELYRVCHFRGTFATLFYHKIPLNIDIVSVIDLYDKSFVVFSKKRISKRSVCSIGWHYINNVKGIELKNVIMQKKWYISENVPETRKTIISINSLDHKLFTAHVLSLQKTASFISKIFTYCEDVYYAGIGFCINYKNVACKYTLKAKDITFIKSEIIHLLRVYSKDNIYVYINNQSHHIIEIDNLDTNKFIQTHIKNDFTNMINCIYKK